MAFNQTFEEFGLPVRWSVDDYKQKVLIGGGKERLASLLTPEFVAAAGLPADPDGQRAAVAAWHRRKTEIYTRPGRRGARSRPGRGSARLVGEALAGGLDGGGRLDVGRAVGRRDARAGGRAETARQVTVFAGDVVADKKPAPDIYLLALAPARACQRRPRLVVEDSRNGLLAAVGAGLTCLVTVNELTAGEDFSEAAMVVSSLGDPGDDAEPTVLIANHSPAPPPGTRSRWRT